MEDLNDDPDKSCFADLETLFSSDPELNKIYPENIQKLSRRHWTPLLIATEAAQFLANNQEVSILDIGSGVGKFCIAAGYFHPKSRFTGIEQREELVAIANITRERTALSNVTFMSGNFTTIDFSLYDHFYFYNAFYENLSGTEKIDENLNFSADLYHYYTRFLFRQLEMKPSGTRLVTYFSLEDEVPPDYHVVKSSRNENLKFWVKI